MKEPKNSLLINFFEASEHPIDDNTRKHKIQLLLYSFLIWICFFSKGNEVIMIFGVKFQDAISPTALIPILFILVFYHFILFLIQLDASLTNWRNKSFKNETIPYIPSDKNEKKMKYCLNLLEEHRTRKKIDSYNNTIYLLEKKIEKLDSCKTKMKSIQDKVELLESNYKSATLIARKLVNTSGDSVDDQIRLNKIKDDFPSYHRNLKQAYDDVKNKRDPSHSLSHLDCYFDSFDVKGLEIISKTEEIHGFYETCKTCNDKLERVILEVSGNYTQTHDLYRETFNFYIEQYSALIEILKKQGFKEDVLTFKLPFIWFPIFFGFSTFYPLCYFLINS